MEEQHNTFWNSNTIYYDTATRYRKKEKHNEGATQYITKQQHNI